MGDDEKNKNARISDEKGGFQNLEDIDKISSSTSERKILELPSLKRRSLPFDGSGEMLAESLFSKEITTYDTELTLEQQLFGNILSDEEDDDEEDNDIGLRGQMEENMTNVNLNDPYSTPKELAEEKSNIFEDVFSDSSEGEENSPAALKSNEYYKEGLLYEKSKQTAVNNKDAIKVAYQDQNDKIKGEDVEGKEGENEEVVDEEADEDFYMRTKEDEFDDIDDFSRLLYTDTNLKKRRSRLLLMEPKLKMEVPASLPDIQNDQVKTLSYFRNKLKFESRGFTEDTFLEIEKEVAERKAAKQRVRQKYKMKLDLKREKLKDSDEELEQWYSSDDETLLPTVRWRKNDKTGKVESNSSIVQWEDGTYTLFIGDYYYDILKDESGLSDPDTYFLYYDTCNVKQGLAHVKNMNLDFKENEDQALKRRQRTSALNRKRQKRGEGKSREQNERGRLEEAKALEDAEKEISKRRKEDGRKMCDIIQSTILSMMGSKENSLKRSREIEKEKEMIHSDISKNAGDLSSGKKYAKNDGMINQHLETSLVYNASEGKRDTNVEKKKPLMTNLSSSHPKQDCGLKQILEIEEESDDDFDFHKQKKNQRQLRMIEDE